MLSIFTLLKQGRALANAQVWKDNTALFNIMLGFLGAFFFVVKMLGYDLQISDDVIREIATGVVGVAGLYNGWLHFAANKDKGLPASGEPVNT